MNSFQGPDSLDECSLCNGTGQINRSSFGKMLRNERNILGITQQKIAGLCGLTTATISLIENGGVNPRRSTVMIIEIVLDKLREASVSSEESKPLGKED
jgi:transcriptional regulator with XRE-family HTH domain